MELIKDSAGNFLKLPSIVEGLFVNMVRSDEPTSVLISFKTIEEGIGKAVVGNKEYEESAARKNHEIKIEGLMPDTKYYYYVSFNGVPSPVCSFRTAPKKGDGEVVFAYTEDSREGVGGGERNFMGVNYQILEREMNLAYNKGADFVIFGGDIINGYTSSKEDFETELYAWKQAVGSVWHSVPVYPAKDL